MDFDRLPHEILRLILQHLPFKDRVLVARVNRQFNEASKMVISQTKTFNLTASIFHRMPVESMKELIESFADSLEKMVYVIDFWDTTDREYKMMIRQRLRFVLGVSFPRLSTIALDVHCYDTDCCKLIRAFLVKNTNIRAFERNCDGNLLDKVDFLVFEKLERIELQSCNSDMILSFSNYFTSLKHLIVDSLCGSSDDLNVAFGKWPSLLTLEIRDGGELSFEKIESLWQMASLRRLVIGSGSDISDEILQKIPSSFPQLVHLEFCLHSNRVTNEGIKWLESMKNLRQVKVRCSNSYSNDIDILGLIGCKCLHVVEFKKQVSPMTVVCFALGCPNLRQLIVSSICGIETRKSASLLVSSLDLFIQEKLSIIIRYSRWIWDSPEVESALENVNSTGRRLSIEVRPAKAIGVNKKLGDWGSHSDHPVMVQIQQPPLPPPSRYQRVINRWDRMIDRWHMRIYRIRAFFRRR